MFQIKKLKGQLAERQKNGKLDTLHPEDAVLENGTDVHVMDLQSKCQPSCGSNHSDVRDVDVLDVDVLIWRRGRGGEQLWQGKPSVLHPTPTPRNPDYKSRDISQ